MKSLTWSLNPRPPSLKAGPTQASRWSKASTRCKCMGETSESYQERGPGADEALVRCRWEAPQLKTDFSFSTANLGALLAPLRQTCKQQQVSKRCKITISCLAVFKKQNSAMRQKSFTHSNAVLTCHPMIQTGQARANDRVQHHQHSWFYIANASCMKLYLRPQHSPDRWQTWCQWFHCWWGRWDGLAWPQWSPPLSSPHSLGLFGCLLHRHTHWKHRTRCWYYLHFLHLLSVLGKHTDRQTDRRTDRDRDQKDRSDRVTDLAGVNVARDTIE